MWMASNLQFKGLQEAIKVLDGKKSKQSSSENQVTPEEANKDWRRLVSFTRNLRNGNA